MNPSIQSYYKKDPPAASPVEDAFQGSTRACSNTGKTAWVPRREYRKSTISELECGPLPVVFEGRIVNFSLASENSSRPWLSQAYHSVLVKDDTGVIAVQVQSSGDDDPRIQLGRKVTIWTALVSDYSVSSPRYISGVLFSTTIYLGQTAASYIHFHDESSGAAALDITSPHATGRVAETKIEKTTTASPPRSESTPPPSFSALAPGPGLMTLRAFLAGGHKSQPAVHVLVCVKSIGPKKTITGKTGPAELVDVKVFDETVEDCNLTIWGNKIPAARSWTPNRTVLMLTNPTFRGGLQKRTRAQIGVDFSTMVDVDPPSCSDADWLRHMATSRDHSLYITFPQGIFDVAKAVAGDERLLFSIADADEEARRMQARPGKATSFVGKLNVVVLHMHLVDRFTKGRLCCHICCGVSLYSNQATARCRHCGTMRELCLNPRVVGIVADETGSVAAGKLVWSDDAWTQLFFPGQNGPSRASDAVQAKADEFSPVAPCWQELTVLDRSSLHNIEESLLHVRLTLTFGWHAGRLCIMWVEW